MLYDSLPLVILRVDLTSLARLNCMMSSIILGQIPASPAMRGYF